MYQYPGASKEARLVLSGVSVIAIVCFLIWNKYYATSFAQNFLDNSALEVFHGKIDSIYNDVPNHNERIALLSDGYKFAIWPEWESKFSVGDSLDKKGKSLKIEIYKKDGKRIELNYKEIAKGFRKDLQ
jgi:hypothetical protein